MMNRAGLEELEGLAGLEGLKQTERTGVGHSPWQALAEPLGSPPMGETLLSFAEPLREWFPSWNTESLLGFASAVWNATGAEELPNGGLIPFVEVLAALPGVQRCEARRIVRALAQRRSFRFDRDKRRVIDVRSCEVGGQLKVIALTEPA